MNSCACISYRSKKRFLQACAYATAICVKLNCELSNDRVSHNFTSYLYNMLKKNGKL